LTAAPLSILNRSSGKVAEFDLKEFTEKKHAKTVEL
jgi:hypothetical protein